MWTVYQFTLILHGQVENIRIETPGIDKVEFEVKCFGWKELHQVKRSHTSGKWSLSSLASDKIQLLQAVFSALLGNKNKFIFVPTSDAPELRELSERARQAGSIEEFESSFLAAKAQKESFNKLIKCFQTTDCVDAFDVLRRIEVHTIDEEGLREKIILSLKILFLVNPNTILDRLRAIAEDSIHKTITRLELKNILEQSGFKIRQLLGLKSPIELIREVTDNYLTPSKKKLIHHSLIQRKETQNVLEKIGIGESGTDFRYRIHRVNPFFS